MPARGRRVEAVVSVVAVEVDDAARPAGVEYVAAVGAPHAAHPAADVVALSGRAVVGATVQSDPHADDLVEVVHRDIGTGGGRDRVGARAALDLEPAEVGRRAVGSGPQQRVDAAAVHGEGVGAVAEVDLGQRREAVGVGADDGAVAPRCAARPSGDRSPGVAERRRIEQRRPIDLQAVALAGSGPVGGDPVCLDADGRGTARGRWPSRGPGPRPRRPATVSRLRLPGERGGAVGLDATEPPDERDRLEEPPQARSVRPDGVDRRRVPPVSSRQVVANAMRVPAGTRPDRRPGSPWRDRGPRRVSAAQPRHRDDRR